VLSILENPIKKPGYSEEQPGFNLVTTQHAAGKSFVEGYQRLNFVLYVYITSQVTQLVVKRFHFASKNAP
jgi:hypothetical protein